MAILILLSLPISPFPIEHPAGANPEEQIEYSSNGTELVRMKRCSVKKSWVICCAYYEHDLPRGVSRCQNDDIEYDAESIYGKAEEDAVLVVLVNDAPDEGEEEEDVVKED